MQKGRTGVLLVGLVVVLAACGRVPPTSSAAETPSSSPADSPIAAPTPLTIPGPTFHPGEVALAYTPVTIEASGGNAPYIWRVSDGALPGGLDISPDGVISGTPSASGTFTFTLEVMDAGLASAHLGGSINIVPRLAVYATNPAVLFGETSAYIFACVSTNIGDCPWKGDNRYAPFATIGGGDPPYTYSLIAQMPPGDGYIVGLPPGTSLKGLALTGQFQLKTGSQAVYRFAVRVTDSLGASATIVVVVNIKWANPGP